MKTEIIGDFDLIPKSLPAEGTIHLDLKPIDLMTYWRRCGLTSNFIANFYKLTPKDIKNENSVSTVFNELIENATKYSTKRDSEIVVDLKLYDIQLLMQVKNTCNKTNYSVLKKRLEKLQNTEDLENLYIEEMIKKGDSGQGSGIGLLLLLKDYQSKIGAKFEERKDGLYDITIQVYYFMEEEELI